MRKSILTWIVVTVLGTGAICQAQQDGWTLSLTPYGWMAGLDGDLSAGGLTVPIDQSFSDIFDNLDFAAMLALDANNGTYGVRADMLYLDLGDKKNTAAGTIKGEVEQWIVNVTPYLRVKSDETMTLDVGAGGRYIDSDIDLRTPAQLRSQTRNWIDPILVARAKVPVANNCYLQLTGDIGGFGVESDLTWQVALAAGYSITPKMDVLVGYRHLDVDYEDGDFAYDVATSGLGVGLTISL